MYPPQKPPDLDDNGNPVGIGKPPDLDEYGNPATPEQSFGSQVWQALNEPLTDLPSRASKLISNNLPSAMQMRGDNSWHDTYAKFDNQVRGFLQGATEGAGDLATAMTSPINLGVGIASGGSNLALKAGLPEIAEGLSLGSKVASLPMIGHGLERMSDPNATLGERGQGLVEFAGGGLGLNHTPRIDGPLLSRLPQKWFPEQAAEAIKPPTGGIPDVIPPPENGLANISRLVLKQPKMADIVRLTDEGFIASDTTPEGGVVMTRPNRTPIDSPPTPIDPNLNAGEGNPELAGSTPYSATPIEAVPEGVDPTTGELFEPTPRRASRLPPSYGFGEQVLGSSESSLGQRLPGDEAFDIGDINQPIDLNQAELEMGSDLAKPVQGNRVPFDEQVLGRQPISNAEMFRLTRSLENDRPTNIEVPDQLLPHDIQPDIPMSREPQMGGYSPSFGEQVAGPKPISFETPDRAVSDGGEIKIGADVKSLGKILGSSLYQGNIKVIATKELLQNALDAIRPMGPVGKVNVSFNRSNHTLQVVDNGKGMTPNEVATILTDLGSSGKRSDESAIGGFGLAKASFLLGGEHVTVVTIARDTKTGKIIKTTLAGSPDELLSGVKPVVEQMPPNTPTGTDIKVKTPKDDTSFYDAQNFVKNVSKYSEFEGQIHMSDRYGPDSPPEYTPVGKEAPTEVLGTVQAPGGDVRILSSNNANNRETTNITMMMRNKGMYQGSHVIYLDDSVKIPDRIVVDVDSNVPEGHSDYPFTANRENLRGTVQKEVENWINDNLVNPSRGKRAAKLKEAYETMPTVVTPDNLTLKYFDTGSKYTPEEFAQVQNSPIMHRIGDELNRALETLQNKFNGAGWVNRLEHVGFVFDDKLRGIHIPNPGAEKSMILINPLQIMSSLPPDEAAAGFAHVILHEFAHVDPHVGRGHNESFTTNLANIYERYGARETVRTQDEFLKSVTNPNGEYSPEVQELLQRYTESRGREIVKEDILSGTGVGSRTSDSGPTGIPESDRTNGDGASTVYVRKPTPDSIKKMIQSGYQFSGETREDGAWKFNKKGIGNEPPILESDVGEHRPTSSGVRRQLGPIADKKQSKLVEAFNLPRGLMASMDFSAPLRQGIGLIHKGSFWKAMPEMFKAWATEEGFNASQKAISERPLFRPRTDRNGKVYPSFADDAGLKLTDLTDLSNREEAIMSTWAEKIPGVRRSNRAYTAFLNNLRADTFESLVKDGKIFGADAKANLPLARELANFVNTASGRGSLGRLESSAVALNTVLFSPRLIASRVQMMNPAYYIMSSPQVRKEALKSLFAIAMAGNTVTQLGKMAGGSVSMDPTSTDFGKLKIGNTRIDPYGGFQQYIVAASRLLSGKVTSSTTGNEYDLNNPKGPFDPTHADILERFGRGKLHPVVGFAYSLLKGKKEMSGEPMNLSTLNPMENAVAQRFIPILMQDFYQLAEDPDMPPELKAIAATVSTFGMGQQTYGAQ